MSKKFLILLGLLSCFLFFIFSCSKDSVTQSRKTIMKMPEPVAGATKVGNDSCKDCHEDYTKNFKANVHGRIIPGETAIGETGCETCHGAGSVHASSEDPSKIINPKKIDAVSSSSVCLRCHTGDEHQDWNGSAHSLNDVSCTDCHKVHNNKSKGLLVKSEPDLCYSCHNDVKAKMYYPTHHPVKEGKMVCSDCHSNHGSMLNNLKTEERLNDLCLNCHTKYQGPFTFEHSPVVEDCTICHDAHGTIANNLLKRNEPFLCLQCHDLHFHTGISSANTYGLPYLNPTTNANNTYQVLEGSKNPRTTQLFMGTKCTTCHPSVHGSELPSLSVPGHGRALTR